MATATVKKLKNVKPQHPNAAQAQAEAKPKVNPQAQAEAKPKVNPQAQARAEKLLTAFKELGTGKNKIAESLKAKKIRGKIGDSDECPIAVFVKKLFPKSTNICVDNDSIEVSFEKPDFNFSVKTPGLIAQFINDFDDKKYPDLLKA